VKMDPIEVTRRARAEATALASRAGL